MFYVTSKYKQPLVAKYFFETVNIFIYIKFTAPQTNLYIFMSQGNNSAFGAEVLSASKKLSIPVGQNLTSSSLRTLTPSQGAIAYGSDDNLLYFGSVDTWTASNDTVTTAKFEKFATDSAFGADVISASKKLSIPVGQNLSSSSLRTLVPSMGTLAYDSNENLLYFGSVDTWTASNDTVTTAKFEKFDNFSANEIAFGAEVLSASKKLSIPVGQNLASASLRTLVPSPGAIAYDSGENLLYYGSVDTWIASNDVSTTAVFAEFFALMPNDNVPTVAVGESVQFPQAGPNSGNGITALSSTSFQIADIGTYEVSWQVSVTEAGQLVLHVDAGSVTGTVGLIEIARSVVGRATGTSQITNTMLIHTSSANTAISVRNPTGNAAALTITPSAGGTHAVSANLVIRKID